MLDLIIGKSKLTKTENKIFFNNLICYDNTNSNKINLNNYVYPYEKNDSDYLFHLTCSYCIFFAKKFNESIFENYSETFWIRLYWLEVYRIVIVIDDLKQRINFLSKKYVNDKIKVSVFESEEYSCKVETDFFDSLNIELQEQLLSSIINIEKPKNFIISVKKNERKILKKNERKIQSNLKKGLKLLFKKLFFRARIGYGFNYIKIFLIHIFLSLFTPQKKTEQKYAFRNVKWANYDSLIEKLISEKSKKIKKEIILYSEKKFKPGKIRFVNSMHTSLNMRVSDFLASEYGEILIGFQHGGTYGYWKYNSFLTIEYNLDYFLSWGFSNQKNIIPFSSNSAASVISPKKKKNNKIIIVGTDIPVLNMTSENRTTDFQKDEYLKTKIELIKGLSINKYYDLFYRPYISEHKISFNDENFILKHISKEKLIKSNFYEEIGKCSLLIVDHPSTTLALALNKKIPSVLVWDPTHYQNMFSEKFNEILIKLKKIDVYHEDSDSVINFIKNKSTEDLNSWWNSREVSEVINEFNFTFSRVNKYWFFKLFTIFRSLK